MLREERYAEAARLFTDAIVADPHDSEALEHRAAARLELRDFHGANHDAEAALAIDPEAGDAKLTLAAAALELGDDAEATRHVRALLRERRDSPHAWRLLGRLRLRAGAVQAAARAFRRSLRDSRYDALSHYWLAECLEQMNDPERARQRRERAYLLDPSLERNRPRP
jgi:tetratricopeptide (TPR) repeat protein